MQVCYLNLSLKTTLRMPFDGSPNYGIITFLFAI